MKDEKKFGITIADEVIEQAMTQEKHISEIVVSEPEQFEIETVTAADWAVRRLLRRYSQTNEILSYIDENINKLQQFRAELLQRTEQKTQYLRDKLKAYTKRELEGEPERSIMLPSARLSLRKPTTKIVITDEKTALETLSKEHSEFVKIKASIDKAALKKHIKATGEIIEGVELQEGEESFAIKEHNGAVLYSEGGTK